MPAGGATLGPGGTGTAIAPPVTTVCACGVVVVVVVVVGIVAGGEVLVCIVRVVAERCGDEEHAARIKDDAASTRANRSVPPARKRLMPRRLS